MRFFIDLGAYDGDTIEKAIQLYPDCEAYYAFEPYLPNFEKLKSKFADNKKIHSINAAAFVKDGTMNLYLHKDHGIRKDADEGGTLEQSKTNIDKNLCVEVKTVNFSKFIKENFSKSDEIILKIDIEGSEYDLLEKLIADGAITYIKKIFCEWHKHKTNITEKRHTALISKLNELGFKLTGNNDHDEFSKISSVRLLSIVIATYNRKGVLNKLLDSLKEQTDKSFEVVVAVDGSRDGTLEMLAEYRKSSPFELRWLDTGLVNEYGLAPARNMGIKEAKGEAVVILDDDSFPVKEFVAEHKRTVKENTLTGGGRIGSNPSDSELQNKMRAYLETFGDSVPQKFKPVPKYKWVVENNTCMFKTDWLRSGMFDEKIREYGIIGQTFNKSLIQKGFKYQFNPRASIIHHTEYKQNDKYEKTRHESNALGQNKVRAFLRKKVPFVYESLKKIKHYFEYR